MGGRFGLAPLHASRINIVRDLPTRPIQDASGYKQATGGDTLEAELKGLNQRLRFRPTCPHIFGTNILPRRQI